MTAHAESVNDSKSFSYRKTFIVGFGFLGISIIWPIFNQFIPIFLQAGNPEFERQLLEAGLYYISSQLAAVPGPTTGGVMVNALSDLYRWLFVYSAIFMALALLAMTRVKNNW